MVNPNDPNSEPDGTPASDSTPDPNSGDLSSESGPISDELFDSLSELLGDSPPTDEPASLPDVDSWSDQSAEATATPAESIEESPEAPTLIQFDTTAEDSSDADDLSPTEDSSPIDLPFAATTSDTPQEDLPPISEALDTDQTPDPWTIEPTEAIASDQTPQEIELPTDPPSWTSEASEQPEDLVPDGEAVASEERLETLSDPWADPSPDVSSAADPIPTDIEEPTIIQAAGSSEARPEPPDLELDTSPATESTSSDAGDPSASEFLTADTPDTDPPVDEPLSSETDVSADWTDEESPVVSGPESFPPDRVDREETPAAEEIISEPIASMATEDADTAAEEIPLEVSADDGPSTPLPLDPMAPVVGVSESSDREPEGTPRPEPVAVGASPPVGSGPRPSMEGDLGALSNKLPLNRYQAVGLLVALSTLGTIAYLGVTGNQQDPPIPSISTPSAPPVPGNTNQSGVNPSTGVAVRPPQSQDGIASQPDAADPADQTTANPPSVVPPASPDAIGGIDTPQAIPSQLDISDVPPDHWAYPFITKLHAQGIIPDYPDGKFQPDQPVTRAELAAQIQRAFLNEPGQRSLTFSDISADYWAAQAIEGAVNKKFMSGYPEGDFRPDQPVPRYEALVALVSGLGLDLPSSPEQSLQRFQDQGQLPNWSKGKIAASTQSGIVVNHPNPALLEPKTAATRAEVAVMIYQALVQTGRLDPINSDYVVAPDS